VLRYWKPECHTDLLCSIRFVIYSAKHRMDVGSEIVSNQERATCILHTVTQRILKVTVILIKALYQNIHEVAEQNHE